MWGDEGAEAEAVKRGTAACRTHRGQQPKMMVWLTVQTCDKLRAAAAATRNTAASAAASIRKGRLDAPCCTRRSSWPRS